MPLITALTTLVYVPAFTLAVKTPLASITPALGLVIDQTTAPVVALPQLSFASAVKVWLWLMFTEGDAGSTVMLLTAMLTNGSAPRSPGGVWLSTLRAGDGGCSR